MRDQPRFDCLAEPNLVADQHALQVGAVQHMFDKGELVHQWGDIAHQEPTLPVLGEQEPCE